MSSSVRQRKPTGDNSAKKSSNDKAAAAAAAAPAGAASGGVPAQAPLIGRTASGKSAY